MASYVIVGASRGIGYEWLKQLSANNSNKVVGTVRDKAATQSRVTSDNLSNVNIITADMTDPKSLENAAKETRELTGGEVDYLVVNGAYMNQQTDLLKPTEFTGKEKMFLEELKAAFETNTAGVLFTINAFLPLVRASSVKKIIVLSTGLADPELIEIAEVAGALTYTASKVAVNTIVQKYAIELKPEGITILAISPGLVDTLNIAPQDMPPETLAALSGMMESCRKYDPAFQGPISPTTSVEMMLKVINGITLADSGRFISHKGDKRWI